MNKNNRCINKFCSRNVSTNEQDSLNENVLYLTSNSQAPSTCSFGKFAWIMYCFPCFKTLKMDRWTFSSEFSSDLETTKYQSHCKFSILNLEMPKKFTLWTLRFVPCRLLLDLNRSPIWRGSMLEIFISGIPSIKAFWNNSMLDITQSVRLSSLLWQICK